ncbi:MAG: carboxypeptidase-like regulatory domain-containing protein [Myxacorys chilensis ATA2-1-KO14]|nr:carboxypeptidase-like regulatory domain-containing protein [Myxacorys chilensis ATA2-1-KO14]
MDLSNLPRPLLIASIICFSLVVGYGASKHIPWLTTPEQTDSTKQELKSVKIRVLDADSQQPVVGAQVIIESEGGADSDTTDNLGVFRIQIPKTDYVRVRISRNGFQSSDQNLNLLSNPDRVKSILLKRINSK